VNANEDILLARNITHDERKVLFVINRIGIQTQLKLAIPVWHTRT